MAASLILPATSQAVGPPRVLIDGKELKTDVPGLIYNDRSMVPFRAILEALDAQVNWNEATRTVLAQKGQTEISLQIDNNVAWVNTQTVKLDAPAIIVDNRTMVPVRFVAESLGETVDWDANKRIVRIETSKKAAEPEQPVQPTPDKISSGSILSENESLEYSKNNSALFLKGTEVNFYPNGMVSNGVLAEDQTLKFSPSLFTYFKGNTPVFFVDGLVTQGTLVNDTILPYTNREPVSAVLINKSDGKSATFKGGTEVIFEGGLVKSGELGYNTSLPCPLGSVIEFMGGTIVNFNEQGYIERGYLFSDTYLQYIDNVNADKHTHIYFKGGTEVQFNDKGFVASGTLRDDNELKYSADKSLKFAGNSIVEFNEKGYVKSGILAEPERLEYAEGSSALFMEGTVITFGDDGYVVCGTLRDEEFTKASMLKMGTTVTFGEGGSFESGTLRDDMTLPYASGRTARFKGGSPIKFNSKGYVTTGTIKDYQTFPYSYRHVDSVTIAPDSQVVFNKGYLQSGILLKDTVLSYAQGKNTTFKAGSAISFGGKGYVIQGTLKHNSLLENIQGQEQNFPANSVVSFNENGQVASSS